MSCALGYPQHSTDLTHGWFLWQQQLSTTQPGGTSSTRVQKSQNRRANSNDKVVFADSFQHGLVFLAGRVLSELTLSSVLQDGSARLPDPHTGRLGISPSVVPASYSNNPYGGTLVRRDVYSPTPTRPFSLFKKDSRSRSPIQGKRLKPPRPRLSSPLSPKAVGTVLPGHSERRSMPFSRKKDQDLYRVVLERSVVSLSSVAKSKRSTVNKTQPNLTLRCDGLGDFSRRWDDGDDGIFKANSRSLSNSVENNVRSDGRSGTLSDSWVVVPSQSTWDIVTLEEATF